MSQIGGGITDLPANTSRSFRLAVIPFPLNLNLVEWILILRVCEFPGLMAIRAEVTGNPQASKLYQARQ